MSTPIEVSERRALHVNKPKQGARNVIDIKWVLKLKIVTKDGKTSRVIRARLTVRGFKDRDADDMTAFSATCSRWAQRIVVGEAALRKWPMALTDVPKAFLQGITCDQLAEESNATRKDLAFTVVWFPYP